MPAVKRKFDDWTAGATKRNRISADNVSSTEAVLENLSKEDLIDMLMRIHNHLTTIPNLTVLTEEQLSMKISKARRKMVSGISKQMRVS